MARLKTVGFEQNTLTADSELFFVFGNPKLVTNIDPGTNQATLWNDLTETWNSENVPWDLPAGQAIYDPQGVRSGYFALRVNVGDFFDIKASSKGGGGYNRVYVRLKRLPNAATSLCYFIRNTDDLNVATIELQPDGRLRFQYRNDAGVKTYLGDYSNPLELNRYYCIELAIIGAEAGTDRHFECRLDHSPFMAAEVNDQSSYDGYFGAGPNYDADDAATVCEFYCDDLATNDGRTLDWDDNSSWCGPGKVVLLPVTGDDEAVGNNGWTRGGADTGSDWGQIADASPPNDATNYLVADSGDDQADFRLGNPYEVGIKDEDTIKVVAANMRWSMEDDSEGANVYLYLRAGPNLDHDGAEILLFDTDWFTGDATGQSPDVFSTSFLPQTTKRWKAEDLARARIGMQVTDDTPDIYVTSLWALVEYVPYELQNNLTIEIGGVDRSADLKFQTLVIDDHVNEQANTAGFGLYDHHSLGAPETDDEVIIKLNGVTIFAGHVVRNQYVNIGKEAQYFVVQCTDYTRILDRRLVSATYQNMTDKAIIETLINEYGVDSGITTYHVSEGVTVNQISFNYIPLSQAIQQLAELTGRDWFVDYEKDIHYFPVTAYRAPFEIDNDTRQTQNFNLTKDASRLRNRVFVRGGVERTSEPLVETVIADGEQRQFFLAERPYDLTIQVNSVGKTVGIKNIDSPDDFDFLMNFQEKYVECGTNTVTPAQGDEIEFSYNYDVPILVSVEDSDSIAENGVYEFPIIDKQIASVQAARDRAAGELSAYASDLVEASYMTYEPTMRSGMYQHVELSAKSVNEDYIVQRVVWRSIGGGRFVSTVDLASTKTLGIIKFLIDLLQINRTVGDFDPNEKVDQLFTLTDSLDSLTDSLGIDSAPTAFKWSNDAGTTPDKLKYNLGQWT